MIAPLGYEKDCAPRALAAVLGITFADAARIMWPHRQFWTDPRRRAPAGTAYGTSERALEDVLVRSGCLVDHFDGHGRLMADTEILGAMLRMRAHERVGVVRRTNSGQGAAAGMPESSPEPSAPSWLDGLDTLTTWLERHNAGHWLYLLTHGEDAHVVAAYGPQVLVGDPEGAYRDWLVYDAYRVHPPKTSFQPEGATK